MEQLRKESTKLQTDLDQANEDKLNAEKEQETLRQQYDFIKAQNEAENAKYMKEQADLKELRKKKIELGRSKELQEKECEKLSNEL